MNEGPLDYKLTSTEPLFLDKTKVLLKELKKLSSKNIEQLMKISPKLADLNYDRFKKMKVPLPKGQGKPALFLFNGETYRGLDVFSYTNDDLKTAQKKLRILSGLYGLLAPKDLISSYRLEMGTLFSANKECKDLYQFWKETLTKEVLTLAGKTEPIINLASKEYFRSIDYKSLGERWITPHFKENKNGQYKVIGVKAKKARGMMASYIIKNKIKDVEALKEFNREGYKFSKTLSGPTDLVFIQ